MFCGDTHHISCSLIIITAEFQRLALLPSLCEVIIKVTTLGPLSRANLHPEKLIFISGVKKDT